MNFPNDLMYTKSHEWIKMQEDGTALVGLSDYAQDALGDLVFVNLPEAGDEVSAGEPFADVESVKAVSDVYSRSPAWWTPLTTTCWTPRKPSMKLPTTPGSSR